MGKSSQWYNKLDQFEGLLLMEGIAAARAGNCEAEGLLLMEGIAARVGSCESGRLGD
jgi:hypothetical protein